MNCDHKVLMDGLRSTLLWISNRGSDWPEGPCGAYQYYIVQLGEVFITASSPVIDPLIGGIVA
jgi:hypothetical protein